MTTNKPEVVAWLRNERSEYARGPATFDPMCVFGSREPQVLEASYSPVVMLSDYEALQAECEKLRKDAERYQSLLEAVLREIPHREGRRGNAPGHCHAVPGVWDEDNGALAGKECAWCKVWSEALTAIQEHNP